MSSTILHESGLTRDARLQDDSGVAVANGAEKNPFLVALGERVRDLRARRGLTRKAAAQAAGVSERHLANLEYGSGNASILVLQHIADALQCSLAGLLGDVTTSSPEWILLRELLEHRDEATLRRVRIAVGEMLGTGGENAVQAARSPRVALIGLRGAGKTTLGGMLAEDLDFPFVELSREIEKFAGCSIAEIQGLYGMNAYRRYERRAVEEAIQIYPEAVIATPGGLVSDPATFNLLLAHCTTVWLQADAEDHMERVRAQGDFRPMAASKEAMEDLRHILAGRAAFYSKAEFSLNTSAQPLEPTFAALRELVRTALQMPG
ncbi:MULTISPECIES: helix-turn-helix transcriptional regulator [unclassified Cupriavidus]|uniref:helix-turn-helix transcriptional regulator n=1 Tax=unclassified Cupriavidus TaxID=2640874 RepID=UPI001AEA6AB6|nr:MULTISPECIES: helix-turn-helix transcriptional regulator [unclassified Cupriavidus]MBP0630658.1 helix-turn-helix transcriptional regulator [Cupriavidus sp. AcVe19-1a]MBP0634860.1 helix-turn-helix transcriptional regulator [Cupriavidus sp. AcVe19-6a]